MTTVSLTQTQESSNVNTAVRLLLGALLLFLYTPGTGVDLPLTAGFIAVMVLGEVIIRVAEKRRHASRQSQAVKS